MVTPVRQITLYNTANFDCSNVQVVAVNGGATVGLGDVTSGNNVTLDIKAVSGDVYKVKITSTQGSSAQDNTQITYVNNAKHLAEYQITGTATQPAVTFIGFKEIKGLE